MVGAIDPSVAVAMRGITEFSGIYLCRDRVDFRKGVDGLAALIEVELKRSVLEEGSLFVFCNRGGNKMKALYWDRTGFAMWYKRLEKERFAWPRRWPENIAESISLRAEQFSWLLQGIDIWKIKTHENLSYERFF